jgi:hypothetical protein
VVYRSTPRFQVQVRELAALPYWGELVVTMDRLTGEDAA